MQGTRQIQHDGYAHREFVKSDVPSSWFDLSHSRLMTFDIGELIPMLYMETMPGDYFELKSDILIRLAPLIAPLMHNIKINTRYYFIPHRLVWNESGASFTDFVTGGVDGTDASVWPYINNPTYQEGTLADYLGFPIENALGNINAIPFRCYAEIYNEYFRNEDVQTALTVNKNDGADATTSTTLKNVNWMDANDYFVSAMELQQKGTAVELPLGTSAPIYGTGTKGITFTDGTTEVGMLIANDANGYVKFDNNLANTNVGTSLVSLAAGSDKMLGLSTTSSKTGMLADLSTATAATIQEIREASAVQLLYELLEMSGSRYRNYLQAIFGVNDYEDARLQLPEILGGKTSDLIISEVLQTSKTDGTALGTMGGHAIGPHNIDTIKFRCKEHGSIMGLIWLIPLAIYQEGIFKPLIQKDDRFDVPTPQLALIGNQPILNKELYVADTGPTLTFAYQRRYGEYMYMPSSVHADFRSEADTSLEYWHLARDFSADVAFDDTFLTCTPDKARIFASSSTDCVYAQIMHYIKARRPLPSEVTPYKLI